MSFDFDQPDTPESVVSGVVSEMTNAPAPTDAELEQRWADNQAWLAERAQREAQHRAEVQERERLRLRVAQREAKIAYDAEQSRLRLERNERNRAAAKEAELALLKAQVRQQGWWQTQVQAAIEQRRQLEYRHTLMGELEAMINPAPPPEPEVIVVEQPDDKDRPVEVHRWFTR